MVLEESDRDEFVEPDLVDIYVSYASSNPCLLVHFITRKSALAFHAQATAQIGPATAFFNQNFVLCCRVVSRLLKVAHSARIPPPSCIGDSLWGIEGWPHNACCCIRRSADRRCDVPFAVLSAWHANILGIMRGWLGAVYGGTLPPSPIWGLQKSYMLLGGILRPLQSHSMRPAYDKLLKHKQQSVYMKHELTATWFTWHANAPDNNGAPPHWKSQNKHQRKRCSCKQHRRAHSWEPRPVGRPRSRIET